MLAWIDELAVMVRERDRVPNAELRLYEGGHLFMMQDPQAMPDILGFLEGVEPGTAP